MTWLRWVAALALVVAVGWDAAPALAEWQLHGGTKASIAYNQGATFDPVMGNFYFDGVSSAANSGLYRTNAQLDQTAGNMAVIPATVEGYNHAGDLSFDPVRRRVLLPLECYYPSRGGNTCGVGAIGVADPLSLRFLYYVNLDRDQIQKAMWAEVSPDGRWIWTSSGTHLLVYRASEVNGTTARRQRSGRIGGLVGRDLGPVLPSSGVTGAAFYEDALAPLPRLLVALNQGTYSEVVSFEVGATRDGTPTLVGSGPQSAIRVATSSLDNESEGLVVTGAGLALNPFGGVLDWLMLPVIGPSSIFTRILSYLPAPAPPRNGAIVAPRQRLRAVLKRGLRLALVCNRRCTGTATATINGSLARRLGLTAPTLKLARYQIGHRTLRAGRGRRNFTIIFGSRTRTALRRRRSLRTAVTVRLTDVYSRRHATYRITAALT